MQRVNKNKSTSGHWVLNNGIISNMQRKLSKKPERGKTDHRLRESGNASPSSMDARVSALTHSSDSTELATKSHVPGKAFKGSRT